MNQIHQWSWPGPSHVQVGRLNRDEHSWMVRQLAPRELLGREDELGVMRRFCSREQGPEYLGWAGGPWSGKTALLASFALDPPPGVHVVSCFTTMPAENADLSGRLLTVLIGQLLDLLDEAVVPDPGPSRVGTLLGLLDRAGRLLSPRGERLVVIVDGLDEDPEPGSDSGPLASLLPSRLPAGVRFIVAGRTLPPLTRGLPVDHPLCGQDAVRRLKTSPHARLAVEQVRSAVGRVLAQTGSVSRAVVVALMSTRGSLSVADLVELTGHRASEIREVLHGPTGRLLDQRPPRWDPERPVIHRLGRVELLGAGADHLDDEEWSRLLARVPTWASRWGDLAWPEQSPQFLLEDYGAWLDATRKYPVERIALGLDRPRQERMVSLSGTDLHALGEISAASRVLARQDRPDLVTGVRLARRREQLTGRSARIPERLRSLWVTLGRPRRALDLALELPDHRRRDEALIGLAREHALRGDHDRAVEALKHVVDTGRRETSLNDLPRLREERSRAGVRRPGGPTVRTGPVLPAELRELLDTGRIEDAVRAVVGREPAEGPDHGRGVVRERLRDEALSALALALDDRHVAEHGADAHDLDTRARHLTTLIGQESSRAETLGSLCVRAARSGRLEAAVALCTEIPAGTWQRIAVTQTAAMLGEDGQVERAVGLIADLRPQDADAARTVLCEHLIEVGLPEQAVDVAEQVLDAEHRDTALSGIAARLAARSRLEQAERVAERIPGARRRAVAWAVIARALIDAQDPQRAETFAERARDLARTSGGRHPGRTAQALTALVRPLGCPQLVGHVQIICAEALELVEHLDDPRQRSVQRIRIAAGLDAAGLPDRAEALARHPDITQTDPRLVTAVARRLARRGLVERAEALARSLGRPEDLDACLGGIADELARRGDHARAAETAAAVHDRQVRTRVLIDIAEAVLRDTASTPTSASTSTSAPVSAPSVAARIARDAEALARSLDDPQRRARQLIDVLGATHHQLSADQVTVLGARAATAIRELPDQAVREQECARLSVALAGAGLTAPAMDAVESMQDELLRDQVRADVAVALGETGAHEEAARIARDVLDPDWRDEALAAVAGQAARAGSSAWATDLADSIADVDWRAEALTEIARARASQGDADGALSVTRRIGDSGARTAALSLLSRTLVDAGALAAARDIAELTLREALLPPRTVRQRTIDQALLDAVKALCRTGLVDQARGPAEDIQSSDLFDEARSHLAVALAHAGTHQDAMNLARQVRAPGLQALTLARTTAAMTISGAPDRALAEARALAAHDPDSVALGAVAAALATIHQPDRALEAALRIPNPALQATALLDLAGHLRSGGHTRHVARALAWACVNGGSAAVLTQALQNAPDLISDLMLLVAPDDASAPETPD